MALNTISQNNGGKWIEDVSEHIAEEIICT
jgi:hypothetical protein